LKIATLEKACIAAVLVLATACQSTDPSASAGTGQGKAERRQQILRMRDATLERLYKENPEAKDVVAKGAGYAVFDATGVNVVLYVGGKGSGVLVDNATGKPVFMTMVRAGTGPGVGYKEFKQVIVFKTKGAMEMFASAGVDVSGSFDFGSLASQGQSFNPNFHMYTITEKGFTVQANWGGTKYFRDAELD
jgi:lipid-binding SYLF domain-containing protein